MTRLAILGSTHGSILPAFISALLQKKLKIEISLILSNKFASGILARAAELGLATQFIDPTGLSRESYDQQVSNILSHHHIDLIVLIGYMRILSNEFVEQWHHQIINVHPSLLPAFAGKMDLDVHRAVLEAKVNETGCTVHYVTVDVDAGPIILQKKCVVLPNDTVESLKARVQALEGKALAEAVQNIALADAQ